MKPRRSRHQGLCITPTRVLRWAREAGANVTKSSLMLGCGERREEVLEAMSGLREAQVDVLTLGQYLRPSTKHARMARYVTPEEFDFYRDAGMEMGFKFLASGPLVRSSYRAAEGFIKGILRGVEKPFKNLYGKRVRLPVVR